ncbi:MAG: hypothetical protein NTX88_05190 [Candidatus Atribacteria bacterium]|nr:hypothetical protein [Candidatus Atribacteria bacterium]
MSDQTAFGLTTAMNTLVNLTVTENDRVILRDLAQKVAELAARPIEKTKRELWYQHNELHPTRPVIFCDPENGWNEIIPEDILQCEGGLARHWEMLLLKEIFWGASMGDDRVTEPCLDIFYIHHENDWGMHEVKIGGEDGGSYRWNAPLKDYVDIDKLRFPTLEIDYKTTDQVHSLARDIFSDFLTVRLKGIWWWTLGLTWTGVNLRGLEQIMVDMFDYPDGLHRLMAFLRDGHLAKLDFLEKNNLLSLNSDGTYVGSGGFGYTHELPQPDFDGKQVRPFDMWGFGESQETCYVSPEMFAEFIFPYQLPLLEKFGLNCYGCCEPLDHRWDVVKNVPRLRRVSVSPWANMEIMAEKLGRDYVYSLKPNPADIAVSQIDEDYIRKKIREAFRITKNCRVEIIMKDNHTIGRNPQNVIRWCKIAREEAGLV